MSGNRYSYPAGLASIVVVVLTFVLFAVAMFTKGWTHDLLLEAGVFLVSVKLILMSYRNSVTTREIEMKLDQILDSELKIRSELKESS